MIQRILNTIEEHDMFFDCENIIVGLSGGADSVSLLFLLREIISQKEEKINIIAAHINHMLRGEDSLGDEKYVSDLCDRLKVKLEIKQCNVSELAQSRKISVEMAGREVRYEFFKELSDKFEKCKVAVAHNMDDRVETVLFNVIRGTGISGLKGIPYTRDNVIRPLLDLSKEEIRKYCREMGEEIREDKSNFSNEYTRNKIRLDLIPYIDEKFDVDITEKIIRLSKNAETDDDFILQSAVESMKKCVCEDKIVVSEFAKNHIALKIKILQLFCGGKLEKKHIEKLILFVEGAQSGKYFELTGNSIMKKEYGSVYLAKKKKEDSLCFEYPAMGVFYIEPIGAKVSCFVSECEKIGNFCNSSFNQTFDYDKINNSAVIRNRRDGDVFFPYKGKGSKKLKDFFIDSKMPVFQRNRQILLASGNEIVWIVGMRLGNNYLPDANTKRFLNINIENMEGEGSSNEGRY